MPVNNFSVGRDISLDIIGPSGPIQFNLVTSFESKPDFVDHAIKGIDGITRHATIPNAWSGSFEMERSDATIDNYFSQLEDNYYQGLSSATLTITETIQEADGALSQFKYEGVVLKLDDAGKWAGDATVKQKVSFLASRRRKLL